MEPMTAKEFAKAIAPWRSRGRELCERLGVSRHAVYWHKAKV